MAGTTMRKKHDKREWGERTQGEQKPSAHLTQTEEKKTETTRHRDSRTGSLCIQGQRARQRKDRWM